MKIYLSLLSLLLALPTFGQDWYPWHSGGEYYYSAGEGEQFWIIRQDSIDGDEYLLNSKLVGPGLAGCEDSLGYYGPMLHDYKFYFQDDSTIIDGEYIQFVINHRATVGDIWFHDAIGFSFEALEPREVFGELDSVAVFLIHDDDFESLIDGDSIVLSKSFGIIQMPSFNNYIDGYYLDIDLTLISVKTDSLDYGPRYPLFEDLLPLEMGDYMLYKYTREDNSPYFPGVEFYYGKYYLSRDVIDEDNFSLTYSRVKYVGGLPVYEGIYSDTINRQTWEQIMYSDDRSMNFNPESEYNPIIEDNYNYVYAQSVSEVHFQGQLGNAIMFSWKMYRHPAYVFLDTTSCQFIDIFGSFGHLYSYYSTLTGRYCNHGNSYIDYDSYMPYYDCLIGYSIGDLEWGELSVPTAITAYPQPEVQVFPNPAMGSVQFLIDEDSEASIFLFNSQGVCVDQWFINGSATYWFNGLLPGVYTARVVFSTGEVITEKLVVL